jgi:hypothetical protein
MFTPEVLPRSLMALAVTAAFCTTALADGIPISSDANTQVLQTALPVSIAVDVERFNTQATIGPIRADYAYARSITGKGVTIAVMDTGISADHLEFSVAGKLAQGYNAITGTADVIDRVGHGSHVAGIIGAARNGRGIFGIAYDAQLLPIKVLNDNGSGSTRYLDDGLRYAVGKASIVNVSLSSANAYDPRATQQAVRAGLLIVAAAGNDALANPVWPARFAKEAWANNQIIAVGAVDANNRIASFSNRAGDTAAWFLVAPGVDIVSSHVNGQYVYMSGTSMATPVVSGAAALVKQLWPSLRADQIANILFITATDLGVPGIDPVYGRGLLNVERALQPIGAVTTTTYNGRTVNVLCGGVRPSAATSKLWTLAASGNLRVVGLDDFKRDFSIDLGATVARPTALSVEDIFGSLDRRIEVVDSILADGSRLSVAYDRKLPAIGDLPPHNERSRDARLAAFSLVSKHSGGGETAFGAGGFASSYFGIGGLPVEGVSLGLVPALSNPYFSLVPGASHAAVAQQFGGLKIKFGVLTSALNQTFASQEGLYPASAAAVAQPKVSSALIEISQSFEDAAVSVSFSQTDEANAYLGSQSTGALLFGPNASTSSVQLSGALMLAPGLALAGQASYGFTPATRADQSLFAEIMAARTNAFSLALVASDRIKAGDRFSIAMSQPMRTYSGHVVIDVLSGVDNAGMQTRERLLFSMAPVGRELRTELNYQSPVGKDASAGITFLLRRDPNNMIDASTEKVLAMRYTLLF